MKEQLSESYIQWAHHHFLRSSNLNGGASVVATTWIRSFGAVASQVEDYWESVHLAAGAIPASLVHEIMELAQWSYGRFPLGDACRTLTDTWSGLARVYGAADFANREMDRLKMLTDWAEAIEALRYSGFPGLDRLAAGYQSERLRLDLTKLRLGLHDFKYVGVLLDLLRLYEPRPRLARTSVTEKRRGGDTNELTVSGSGRSAAASHGRNDRLARPSAEVPTFELYGNWRDHWSNTLPGVA